MKKGTFQINGLRITIILIVVIQVILAFQGFDVCDDGFVLTFFQQFFTHPESVEYNFLYWFSGVIGGLWYQLFEEGGVIWFRVLAVIVNTSTFLVSYHLLKRFLPSGYLLLSLCMVLFVNDFGFLSFYHNHLTALLTVISVFYLFRGLTENKWIYFVFTGILLILNGFTRLPNFILFSLMITIPFYYYINNQKLVKALRPIGGLLLGAIFGILLVYGLLVIFGQWPILQNAFRVLFDLGQAEDSAHGFSILLKAQYFNYVQIAIALIEISLIMFITYLGFKWIGNNDFLKVLWVGVIGVGLILWYQKEGIFSIYTLAYIGSVWLVLSKEQTKNVRTIALFSLVLLFTMSIGTGGGIKNAGYMAIWLGLPLFFKAFPFIWEKMDSLFLGLLKQQRECSIGGKSVNTILLVFSFSFLILKANNISKEAYFDRGNRWDKTYAIKNKKAKCIYTTKHRSEIINELLLHLQNYVKPNDYLLAYDHIPMIHFLTETRPYTYNPWPGIYDYQSFQNKMDKAQLEIKDLPVVVIQKFETIQYFSAPKTDYMLPKKNTSILHNSRSIEIMNNFLKKNRYEIIWSNDYFNIYKSTKP